MLSGIFGGSKLPAAEQQNFEKEKSRLSKEVHGVMISWLVRAHEDKQQAGKVDQKKFIAANVVDNETHETIGLLINKQTVLSHIPKNFDCDGIINGLGKTDRAAFDFFYNTVLKKYASKELEGIATSIKNIEDIKNLKDSKLVKIAVLQFMQDAVDENLLDDKYIKLWK